MCFVSRERMSARMQLYICAPFLCVSVCRVATDDDNGGGGDLALVVYFDNYQSRALFVYFTRYKGRIMATKSLTFDEL